MTLPGHQYLLTSRGSLGLWQPDPAQHVGVSRVGAHWVLSVDAC